MFYNITPAEINKARKTDYKIICIDPVSIEYCSPELI